MRRPPSSPYNETSAFFSLSHEIISRSHSSCKIYQHDILVSIHLKLVCNSSYHVITTKLLKHHYHQPTPQRNGSYNAFTAINSSLYHFCSTHTQTNITPAPVQHRRSMWLCSQHHSPSSTQHLITRRTMLLDSVLKCLIMYALPLHFPIYFPSIFPFFLPPGPSPAVTSH